MNSCRGGENTHSRLFAVNIIFHHIHVRTIVYAIHTHALIITKGKKKEKQYLVNEQHLRQSFLFSFGLHVCLHMIH